MKGFTHAILILGVTPVAVTQSKAAKTSHAVSPQVQACKDRLKEMAELDGHFDALSQEKLISIQSEINDCAYAESSGLSKEEVVTAYKIRGNIGKEGAKRTRDAAKVISDDDKHMREMGLKIAQRAMDEEKAYKDLIERYNSLVNDYNGMLRDYRATVEQNGEFLDQMQKTVRAANYNCRVNALVELLNSAQKTEPTLSYIPPTQLHCTSQNIPAALPGLPSWTYTNCY